MDVDKLKLLLAEGYHIPGQCGLCVHGSFGDASASFGTCDIKAYEHGKHTETRRQMSVFRGGSCKKDFLPDPKKLEGLNDFVRFFR
jgi:hypothetical protein